MRSPIQSNPRRTPHTFIVHTFVQVQTHVEKGSLGLRLDIGVATKAVPPPPNPPLYYVLKKNSNKKFSIFMFCAPPIKFSGYANATRFLSGNASVQKKSLKKEGVGISPTLAQYWHYNSTLHAIWKTQR